jgi:hypothetical protein
LEKAYAAAVVARDALINHEDELSLAPEKREEEATETKDAKRFDDLQAFQGAGVQSITIHLCSS